MGRSLRGRLRAPGPPRAGGFPTGGRGRGVRPSRFTGRRIPRISLRRFSTPPLDVFSPDNFPTGRRHMDTCGPRRPVLHPQNTAPKSCAPPGPRADAFWSSFRSTSLSSSSPPSSSSSSVEYLVLQTVGEIFPSLKGEVMMWRRRRGGQAGTAMLWRTMVRSTARSNATVCHATPCCVGQCHAMMLCHGVLGGRHVV